MSTLTLITAGPYSTIQDKGRTGQQALGVLEGGAMPLSPELIGPTDTIKASDI